MKKHHPSSFDILPVKPITDNQKLVFKAYGDEQNLVLTGLPGTGKSFIAMYLGLNDVIAQNTDYRKIVVVRSCVPIRDIGFLPGSEQEKMAEYETPYKAICAKLFPDHAVDTVSMYDILKGKGLIEFESTSFLRGTEFNDCVVFVDEAENMTYQELHSVMTRAGLNCRMIFAGDETQSDLVYKKSDSSGFLPFSEILGRMVEFSCVDFGVDDIVRSALVKNYILTKRAFEHENIDKSYANKGIMRRQPK